MGPGDWECLVIECTKLCNTLFAIISLSGADNLLLN